MRACAFTIFQKAKMAATSQYRRISQQLKVKELKDFRKILSELMERLMKLTLRYFEERSRVSCMYLFFFLSAFRLMLV